MSVAQSGGAGGDGFITITFAVEGQQEIRRKLVTWGAQIQSMAPAWEAVGTDILLPAWRANFLAEGGKIGGFNGSRQSKWAQLAPSTVRDRQRHGYQGAHPILQRSGTLMAGVTERGHAYNVFEVGNNSLTLGTSDPIASFHQSGTRRMPARPIIGTSRGMKQQIVARLNEYIMDIARAQGLGIVGIAGDG